MDDLEKNFKKISIIRKGCTPLDTFNIILFLKRFAFNSQLLVLLTQETTICQK